MQNRNTKHSDNDLILITLRDPEILALVHPWMKYLENLAAILLGKALEHLDTGLGKFKVKYHLLHEIQVFLCVDYVIQCIPI